MVAAVVGLAAVVMLALLPFVRSQPDGRFFAAHELQQSQVLGNDYLKLMADQIRPNWQADLNERMALKKQLREFRDSCDIILARDLRQLQPVTEDFKDRCRRWRDQATDQLADLGNGKPLDEVRTKSNALIEKLTAAILGLSKA